MQRSFSAPVSTALIGPDTLVRQGLQRILHGTRYETRHVAETLDGSQHGVPFDLISFALYRDRGTLLSGLQRVKTLARGVRVVVMGEDDRPDEVWPLLGAGADGYLSTGSAPRVVLATLDAVMLGGTVVPQTLWPAKAELACNDDDGPPDDRQLAGDATGKDLSAQETRILLCLMTGESNKQIAWKLDIVEGTVKVHIKAILRKLHVSNRTQAALWAHGHQGALPVRRGTPGGPEAVLLERLAKASARLATGETLIAKQLRAINAMELKGADPRPARELLALLEDSLRILTVACDRLRREAANTSA